jgi:hypothetical protein
LLESQKGDKMADKIFNYQCSILINLKKDGEGVSSGYNCKIIKNGIEIFDVTPSGNSPEQCLKAILQCWDYYLN